MKRKIGILLSLLLVWICAYALADAAIDETNFPDEYFREVVTEFDTDGDGILSDDELTDVIVIDCVNKSISSLKGVEHFTKLVFLYCFNNQLTTLDVSRNTELVDLNCGGNRLTALDVSKNTALTFLDCGSNRLTTLDVTRNTMLTELNCSFNQLTKLDISENAALTDLYCYENRLTTLNLSKSPALKKLWCYDNQLEALDVSRNTALTYLYCNNNLLTMLNVSKNTALRELNCCHNKLAELDVSSNTALTNLGCSNNPLTTLDVSKNTGLLELRCGKSNLKKLDISRIPLLAALVKEMEPTETDGVLEWKNKILVGDNYLDLCLSIDKGVDVTAEKTKIDISEAKVTTVKDQIYTGKAVKPAVIVKYDNTKLIKGTDYTVTYKNNRKVGTAAVTITGKGSYTGTKTVYFDIVPKAVKLSSLTAGKKELTVKWIKGSNITGYEIEYSLKKNFKDKKTVTITKAAATKTVLKKLQAEKTYYVRIRTYKTAGGKKYFSAWSAVKSRKTK